MANLNKVFIIGNLTRDPELRYTPSGTAVANLRIAVNRRYKDKSGEAKQEVCYLTVVSWDKQAEVCNQYLHKGMRVFIEGRLRPDTNGSPRVFQRSDGTTGSSYEVVATTIKFISPRTEGEAPAGDEFEAPATSGEEDIPF